MATPKPRYCGDGTGKTLEDFSSRVQSKLREFFPDKDAEDDPIWGHPADAFVGHILNAAWWAKSELDCQGYECTKAELRAERNDLLKRVTELEMRLRNISLGLDRLLGIHANPLGCADHLKELARCVEEAGSRIDTLPRAMRADEKQHYVAVELAVRVLGALEEYNIKPAATGDCYFGYTSDAVQILKLIGDDIKLVRDELTWRDIIIKSKVPS